MKYIFKSWVLHYYRNRSEHPPLLVFCIMITLYEYKTLLNFVFTLMFLQQLVVKAASLAIARDGANGGVVRTVNVSCFSL